MNAIELLTQDHKSMRALLEELAGTTTRGVKKRKDLLAKIHANLVAHHADEEEKQMFKRARAILGQKALDDLGERLARRKAELKKQAAG